MALVVSVAPGSGESHGGAQVPLTVHVDLGGAGVGTTNKTLRIVDVNADNSPHDVAIAVTVHAAAPHIATDKASLTFNAVVGVNPADQVVEVSNAGTYPCNFTDSIV